MRSVNSHSTRANPSELHHSIYDRFVACAKAAGQIAGANDLAISIVTMGKLTIGLQQMPRAGAVGTCGTVQIQAKGK